MVSRVFKVVLEPQEGSYTVRRLDLSGCISEGNIREEALQNIRKAIQGWLEAFPEDR